MIIVLILLEIVIASAAHLFLRVGALNLEIEQFGWRMLIEPFTNLELFAGLTLLGISFVLYTFILSSVKLNILYPVTTGSTIVVVTLGSVFILGEPISALQIVGIVAVITGIALVAPGTAESSA